MVARRLALAAGFAAVAVAQSPTQSPLPTLGGVSRFRPTSILVYTGGTAGGTLTSGVATTLSFTEYSPTGDIVGSLGLPTAASGRNFRCVSENVATTYAPSLFPQRTFDGTAVVFPCNDIASGSAAPNNISLRVVGLLRADGAVDTSTRVTTAFRDSTTATSYRTVTSVNGSDIWMTGSTSVSAFHGMHYVPYGNTQTTRVVINNAANQRYVYVGPSWPGSGRASTVPQLYVSMRDALATRGIHYVNDALPTRNVTGAQTTLLPGFSVYNTATTNVTASLIGSFVFEPDALRIWACDTQGWQTLTPALTGTGRPNLVEWVWSTATSRYVRGGQFFLDSSEDIDNPYTGNQIQHITGRYESGVFTLYFANALKLFRMQPLAGVKTIIATPRPGQYFIGVSLPPYNPALAYPSDTASMSMTASNTASVSNTGSVTASPSATRSATASISATSTATTSGGSLPSVTSSATPSTSPLVARFADQNLLVLRGGVEGGTLTNGQAQPLTLVEYTPQGDLVSTIPVPTVSNAVEDGGDGSIRCSIAYSNAGYHLEGFMQRSTNKEWTMFPCNDVTLGAAYPNDIPRRVVTMVRADGKLEQFGVTNIYRNTTGSSSLWRTVTSADGNSFYATGAATVTANAGMVYIPYRGAPGEIISAINGANQRFVHIGPSWPASGRPATELQLYMSIRDPNGLRGVHSVGLGLPTSNVTIGTTLLPGFINYNGGTANITTPLVGAFTWANERELWICDTQGWQAGLVNAPPGLTKINLVQYLWDDVTQAYMRAAQMAVDSNETWAGFQVQPLHGRYENGAFVIYVANNARLFRIEPSLNRVTVLASAPPGTFFISSNFVPVRADLTPVTPSNTRTASQTPTSTGSPSQTPSATTSNTATATSSLSPGVTASVTMSASASASTTGSVTGSPSSTRTPSRSPTSTRSASSTLTSLATSTPTSTATSSITPSLTPSPSTTATGTGSVPGTPPETPTSSITPSGTPSSSTTATPTPSVTATGSLWQAAFIPASVIVLRGGTPGGAAVASAVTYPLALVEYTSAGDVVKTIPVPTSTGAQGYRCVHAYATGGYQTEFYMQRSFDGTLVVFPCNDIPLNATMPNNITSRVIAVLRADGTLSTRQRVTTAFRDSTSSTLFRTVATVDGSGFWMTGTTSSGASNGLHYVPAGSETSTRVLPLNAANQRFVTVGASWPSSGNAATVPQLYVSMRDPVSPPTRGVHYVGAGLPTTNVTEGSTLLPGFAAMNSASNNLTAPLIGSFFIESNGRTIHTCDTQGWQTLINGPAGEKINYVRWVWDDATQTFMRTLQMSLDVPAVNYTGAQVQIITGRVEDGEFVLYFVNTARFFRAVPSQNRVTVLAVAEPGTYFVSVALPPLRSDILPASPSATRTPVSLTATPSNTPSTSNTATGTRTPTGTATSSLTPSGTPPATVTPSSASTGSSTASVTGTPTNTGTPSGSQTHTPSRSGTPTRSNTPSVSASATGSVSATPSETASVSATQTGTASSSGTNTGTPSSSNTNTGTPSSSNTGTPASTGTPTGTPASTASSTTSRAPSQSATKSRLPSASRTKTRTATATKTRTRSATATKTKTKTKTKTPSKKKLMMA